MNKILTKLKYFPEEILLEDKNISHNSTFLEDIGISEESQKNIFRKVKVLRTHLIKKELGSGASGDVFLINGHALKLFHDSYEGNISGEDELKKFLVYQKNQINMFQKYLEQDKLTKNIIGLKWSC